MKTLENKEFIDSYLLLYLLNLDIVKKQIQAIIFVQETIATIGNRIIEVVLPIPSNINKRKEISAQIREIIDTKIKTRQKMQELSFDLIMD